MASRGGEILCSDERLESFPRRLCLCAVMFGDKDEFGVLRSGAETMDFGNKEQC